MPTTFLSHIYRLDDHPSITRDNEPLQLIMRTDVSGASRTDLEVVAAGYRERECVSEESPVIISSAHIPVSRVALPTDYSTIKPTSQPICLGIEKYSLVEPVRPKRQRRRRRRKSWKKENHEEPRR